MIVFLKDTSQIPAKIIETYKITTVQLYALFHHLSVSDRVTDPCHANACRGTQTEDGPAASHCTGDGMADCAWKIPGTDRHFSSSGRDPVFLSADHGTVRKHCFCIYLRGTAWFFSAWMYLPGCGTVLLVSYGKPDSCRSRNLRFSAMNIPLCQRPDLP